MKLENQVVSLELAKKLKELGFKQESLFYWNERPEKTATNLEINPFLYQGILHKTDLHYSAYTVAELGEMLPTIIQKEYSPRYEIEYNFPIKEDKRYTNQDFIIRYRSEEEKLFIVKEFGITSKTEADARAKMLIHLKENNLI